MAVLLSERKTSDCCSEQREHLLPTGMKETKEQNTHTLIWHTRAQRMSNTQTHKHMARCRQKRCCQRDTHI